MEHGNRPTGRKKRIGTGGGNAARRGASGGSFSGGSSSGDRGFSGGGSLIALLLAFLLGRGSGSGNSGSNNASGNNRSGCLKRIITLVIIIAVVSFLLRTCSGSGLLSSLNSYGELPTAPSTSDASDASDSALSELLGESAQTGGNSPTVSTAQQPLDTLMYTPHEPDASVDTRAREKYTTLSGNGDDIVTVMVYLCATDLESNAGMATNDLNEMLKAKQLDDERVHVIVETGGTSRWQNSTIASGKNQIYRVTSEGLVLLEKNLGKQSMVEPDTLSSFIRYCAKNYPANRNILILWDHGGGTLSGYGYDELYPNDTMTLDKIDQALVDGGVKFDWIGFDACLMATLETAVVAERHADYLVSSEAVEPGTGWYYTNWLNALGQDTSIPTPALAKILIDDFITDSKKQAPKNNATLSLIDLAELSGTLPVALRQFSSDTTERIDGNQYQSVASARSGARNFSTSSEINQIDLIHFAENLGTEAASSLAETLKGAVKYNRTSSNISHANGVSVYFPYGRVNSVNTALSTYDKIGMDESYSECVKSFASLCAGGQITSSGTGSVLDVLLGGTGASDMGGDILGSLLSGSDAGASSSSVDGSNLVGALLSSMLSGGFSSSGITSDDLSWLDTDRVRASAEFYSENRLNAEDFQAVEKDGQKVLSLTEAQWALIDNLELAVFLDDGEGYLDLGLDNIVEYNADGDLILDYDGTWVSLHNGDGTSQIVSCYFVSKDENGDAYSITQRVPALLNGQRVDLMLVFDNENEYGEVVGAAPVYDDAADALATSAKGLLEIKDGDVLDFLTSYYAYDGKTVRTEKLGNAMTVDGTLEIWNDPVLNTDFSYLSTYRVTDIYGNHFWTTAIKG